MDGRQRRELRIFLCTAFLLPLAAACLRSRAEGTAVWWLLFGAEAALCIPVCLCVGLFT